MSTISQDPLLKNSVLESLITIESIFVMLTSILGAILMIAGLDSNLSTSLLSGTPFTDFFIPGILLLIIVGSTSTLSSIAYIKNITPSKTIFGMITGLVLSIWISIEVLVLNQPAPTLIEGIYFFLGISMIILSYYLKNSLAKQN